jgi:multidrug efflux pump subunit AcrB
VNRGLIGWFVENKVAANLLMISILLSGLYAMNLVPVESSPQYERKRLFVKASYPGATPDDMEKSVTSRVEEVIFDLPGITDLHSTASSGSTSVTMKVDDGFEYREVVDEVKARVDMIRNFPDDMEIPEVGVMSRRFEVISVVVVADLPEKELQGIGQRVRDEIAAIAEITQVDLTGIRPYEISIDTSEQTLREYGLTLADIASSIRRSSMDLPAGSIQSEEREISIRTTKQAYSGREFGDIIVKTNKDGTLLRVRDIASVSDGFSDQPILNKFNGKKCITIEVYRIGDQDAIHIARQVRQYVEQAAEKYPQEIEISYWRDRSKYINKRIDSLVMNAVQGGILVFIMLSLFLRVQLAFWVLMGLPVSIIGAFTFMPMLDITINYTSIFAFILVLGIVVDDAIVTGENIYQHLEKGGEPTAAAINGTREVGVAVTFGILTTILAFAALLLMEGERSKMFTMIPAIVIPVLLLSLVESKLILPSHLNHPLGSGHVPLLTPMQNSVSRATDWFISQIYQPILKRCIDRPGLTVAIFLAIFIILISTVTSGWLRFNFFPRVQSEVARASLIMPVGTSFEVTQRHIAKIEQAALQIKEKYEKEGEGIITDLFSSVGTKASSRMGIASNTGRVMLEMVPPELRENKVTSMQVAREWRQKVVDIPGAKQLTIGSFIHGAGAAIDIVLYGDSFDELSEISGKIKAQLATYAGLYDITDNYETGNEQVELKLKPSAELLGISLADLAHQVRWAFHGQEVQRFQRGRDEVKVFVRYPKDERSSLDSLKTMLIKTTSGENIPLEEVALISFDRGPAVIQHTDRFRTLHVTAEANRQEVRLEPLRREVSHQVRKLLQDYPGVSYDQAGEAKEQKETFSSLLWGFMLVLFLMYVMLAIPLHSYVQPLVVMSAIPFGLLGGVIGHLLMGIDLSIQSVLGMLALTGVVVNDSLVMVDYTNQARAKGEPLIVAIRKAGKVRFRAILLTSLTTFIGLIPLMFSDNTQAQFLIPMAVSLGYGVLFATFITLLLTPCVYLLVERGRSWTKAILSTLTVH